MESKQTLTVPQALDVIELLPLEDRLTVIEVLQRRWLDQRRVEIAHNVAITLQAVREKRAVYGTLAELKQDLT